MGGVEPVEICRPHRSKSGVGRRLHSGALELGEEILCGVISEPHVSRNELLIQDGSAKEAGKLLLFRRVTRKSEGMAEAGKNKSGDAPLEGLEEGDSAAVEGEGDVGLAHFDAVLGGNRIDVLSIEAEGVQGGQEFARGRVCCTTRKWQPEEKRKKNSKGPHRTSVDIFGMREQGRATREVSEA